MIGFSTVASGVCGTFPERETTVSSELGGGIPETVFSQLHAPKLPRVFVGLTGFLACPLEDSPWPLLCGTRLTSQMCIYLAF